jgi:hypothetical protein
VTEPPALDAPAAALETLLATGDPSPLGGRIASLGTVRAAFAGSVVVDVQLEGASARFAVLRVYDEVP